MRPSQLVDSPVTRSILANTFACIAPVSMENTLRAELLHRGTSILQQHGRLFVVKSPSPKLPPIHFAHQTWSSVGEVLFPSVKVAAKELRKTKWKQWKHYSHTLHLRGKLIQEAASKSQTLDSTSIYHTFPLTSLPSLAKPFVLLDENRLLFAESLCNRTTASQIRSHFHLGEILFKEDRQNPPSRAYLKLYEAFTFLGCFPKKNHTVVELGASPGGWTWVLQQLNTNILAFDRSVLDPRIMGYDKLKFYTADAFDVFPSSISDVDSIDWMISDLVCYPERLLPFLQQWIASGRVRNIVCTLKFQTATMDFNLIDKFAAIPNAELTHLTANKNELTFLWSAQRRQQEEEVEQTSISGGL